MFGFKRGYRDFFRFLLIQKKQKKMNGAKIHYGICNMLKDFWICFSEIFWPPGVLLSLGYVLGMYRIYNVSVSKNRWLVKMYTACGLSFFIQKKN